MPVNFDIHHRLEPRPSHHADLQRGFMAEIADPAWFLGRQWQMGEHQGEDAASPVLVRVKYARRPLQPPAGRPTELPGHAAVEDGTAGPAITPAEAIIEGEAEDWWTLGRRIRIGLLVSDNDVPEALRAELRLPPLPEPYAEFDGYDGRALHQAVLDGKLTLDPGIFAEAPTAKREDHWSPAELRYDAVEFACDTNAPAEAPDSPRLTVRDHDGGDVEWWSADGGSADDEEDWPAPPPEAPRVEIAVQPTRFSYPGAPHPRWWQIEDAQVDIGGFPPDRSHLASLLLLDLVLAHSDDWFTLALEAQIGDVVTIEDLEVEDLFGERFGWTSHSELQSPSDWSLFKLYKVDTASMVIWPSVATPVAGLPLEEIALGVDEDANLLWAVEERAEGLRLTSLDLDPPLDPAIVTDPEVEEAASTYLYRPSTFVPYHWHPYVVSDVANRRAFVQGRLRDYSDLNAPPPGALTPAPIAQLLQNPKRGEHDPMHHIEPAVVPTTGLRLDRRYVLARRTDGSPVLWVQRQRLPLFSPPASGLRFDVVVQVEDDD
jgi:hypothetical protein